MGGKVSLLGWGKSQKVTQLGYGCQQSQQLGEWVLQGWTGDLGDTHRMHSSQLYCLGHSSANIGLLELLLSWLGYANALVMTLSRKRLSPPEIPPLSKTRTNWACPDSFISCETMGKSRLSSSLELHISLCYPFSQLPYSQLKFLSNISKLTFSTSEPPTHSGIHSLQFASTPHQCTESGFSKVKHGHIFPECWALTWLTCPQSPSLASSYIIGCSLLSLVPIAQPLKAEHFSLGFGLV